MAHQQKRGSGKTRPSHLRLVEKIEVKARQQFRDWPEPVLDLPILPVLSRDDEEYAARVARLVAQG
jgi:hypothetical protein